MKTNVEILAYSATESILFLESITKDERISKEVRKNLQTELDLIKQQDKLDSSGITSPVFYLMKSKSTAATAYRLGQIEVFLSQELPSHELGTVKKIMASIDIVLCYMNVKTLMSF